ncbi:PAS domain-containing sensor histidine kinase [Rufibacter latericius]|uniref:histidine kinase n=1 Tax=Rufibacter latericius TaxID=2487040 RepID=A0A3M9MX14_9BACT|nr:PAS domain-containing sensor histidine kinase [Rufibacter latericius]RNI29308.1 PAS domain S-box protein [Rufibacter latericius]
MKASLFQALVEQTQLAYFAYDCNTEQFTYLSPKFQALFKTSFENSPVNALLDLVHPEDQSHVADILTKPRKEGSCPQIEFRVQLPQQEEQWVCLNPFLMKEGQEKWFLLGHVEDITAQRTYNDNIKKYSNKKNSILNIISHDLAGPLGVIRNLSQLLDEHLGDAADEDAHHIISLIERSSQKGVQLLQEFLNQEFLESVNTELISRRVNLVEKFRETMEVYHLDAKSLVTVQVQFKPGSEEIYAQVDDIKFLQVINNLVSNALKFTPEGGSIIVSLEEEQETILVKVADTGVGIPEKFHAELFDKFTKARRPGLRGETSIGLGMSIIKTIVEWHHGKIWFESQEGAGTTFYIRLPKTNPQPSLPVNTSSGFSLS